MPGCNNMEYGIGNLKHWVKESRIAYGQILWLTRMGLTDWSLSEECWLVYRANTMNQLKVEVNNNERMLDECPITCSLPLPVNGRFNGMVD
jgi:hypothetical protein